MQAMVSDRRLPAALTIAGSDSSGGAGIQADLKTFTALGVYGASVVTAVTAQNTTGVKGIHTVPPGMIEDQIHAVLSDLCVMAIKTGMLADRESILAVARTLRRLNTRPLIVDPVMIASSGDPLMAENASAALRDELLPLADMLTPNLHEAALLLGKDVATTDVEMEGQARALLRLGPKAVLLKGGHRQASFAPEQRSGSGRAHVDDNSSDGQVEDILVDAEGVRRLKAPRILTHNTHGTGCVLSAAVTAYVVLGHTLPEAASRAKAFVNEGLRAGAGQTVGHGPGPVDILARLRRDSGH